MARIIYGCVERGGTIHSGEGFSVIHPSTGIYEITFTTPFANTPAIVAMQQYVLNEAYVWDNFKNEGGNTRDNVVIIAIDKRRVKLKTGNTKGIRTSRNFTFIAIGNERQDAVIRNKQQDLMQDIMPNQKSEGRVLFKRKEEYPEEEQIQGEMFYKFWKSFIALDAGRTLTLAEAKPTHRSSLCIGYKGGLAYYYAIKDNQPIVAFYIASEDERENKLMFQWLTRYKKEIEKLFGAPLIWQQNGKIPCRIHYIIEISDLDNSENKLEIIQTTMIDTMIRFQRSLSRFLKRY